MKEREQPPKNSTVHLTFDRDMDPLEVIDLSLDLKHWYNRLILHSEGRADEIERYIQTGEVDISNEKKLRIDYAHLYSNDKGAIIKGSACTFKIPSIVDQSVVSDFVQICEIVKLLKYASPLNHSE